MRKLSEDELMRLAFVRAEAATEVEAGTDPEESAILEQLQSYRLARWGETRVERALKGARSVSPVEIASRPNQTFHAPD